MHLKVFFDKLSNRKAQNRLLKFAIFLFGVATITSTITSYLMATEHKVIILPPAVDERIEISGNDANDAYFKMWAKYAAGLLLNHSPANFEDNSIDLLKITHPSFYNSLDEKLRSMKPGIVKLEVVRQFHPQGKIMIDRKTQEISISGLRIQTAQGQEIKNNVIKYQIKYRMENGRFWLNGISEVDNG